MLFMSRSCRPLTRPALPAAPWGHHRCEERVGVRGATMDITEAAATREAHHDDEVLITWRESGGTSVSTPRRSDLGSRLKRGVASELGGEGTLDYNPRADLPYRSAPQPASADVG